MLDIFNGIEKWLAAGKKFALATVVDTWRSAPRVVGSAMAITEDMEIIGSVSGGCVEGAVIKEAMKVLESGEPKILKFGVKNEDAWTVGLSCGGKITVFVERFIGLEDSQKPAWDTLRAQITQNKPSVLISKMSGTQSDHALITPDGNTSGTLAVDDALADIAKQASLNHQNAIVEHEGAQLFVQEFPQKNKMIIVGSAHISLDLIDLANTFNFETIVIDPRKIFTEETRYITKPNELHQTWPEEVLPEMTLDQDTYAVLLTHDPKIDDQALHILLKSEVAYIGCLGSKKTHAKRVQRLQEAGMTEEEIARIHAPVGVAINAKTPQEIALSVMGEVIAVKNGEKK
ncbi:hypothetical protein BKI52_38405 [marine bacterium AO1-C]|nr:hypothetical protein BKI52_38405 [marine bacterium AO1-C]